MEIMPDHVHLFINAKPTDNPSLIMNRIKGRASHYLRKELPELLKLPTLWTQASCLLVLLAIFVLKRLNVILPRARE